MANLSGSVYLHGGDMGHDADEHDYDAWVAFVCDRIDAKVGFEAGVQARPFGFCASKDEVTANCEEAETTLEAALEELWEEFCAEGFPGADERRAQAAA